MDPRSPSSSRRDPSVTGSGKSPTKGASRLCVALALVLAMTGCTRPSAISNDVDAVLTRSFSDTYVLKIREVDTAFFVYGDAPNCVSLANSTRTALVEGGTATFEWTPQTPGTDTLEVGVWGSEGVGDIVKTKGVSPLRIDIPEFEIDPSKFVFIYATIPGGGAWDQSVTLHLDIRGKHLDQPTESLCAFAWEPGN